MENSCLFHGLTVLLEAWEGCCPQSPRGLAGGGKATEVVSTRWGVQAPCCPWPGQTSRERAPRAQSSLQDWRGRDRKDI